MSLLTENNRQYYEGAQSFTADGINQSFTTTFNTDLVFGAASNTNVNYALNNFKLYTSPNGSAGSYTEYTDPYTVSGNTINITGLQFSALNTPAPSFVSYVDITKDALSSTIIPGDTVSIPQATWDGTGSVGATTSAVISTIIDNGQLRLVWNATTYGNARYGSGATVSINPLANGTQIVVQLKKLDGGNYASTPQEKAYGDTVEKNYGSYAYTSLNDVINNFLVAYVGVGKLIPSVKRTDVVFHAKRGLQEFSYDTLKSVNKLEVTVPHNLSIPIPQDYVNYVNLYWIDNSGVKHVIMPGDMLTTKPTDVFLDDNKSVPIQDSFNNNVETTSITNDRWKNNFFKNANNQDLLNDSFAAAEFYSDFNNMVGYGQQYGLDPQYANANGYFNIDERYNKFSFSANLVDRIVVLEYISDGLASNEDTKIPKMAEEALYAHISHAILASRINQSEYIVNRLKRERSAKLRNAKIRLSNIKLNEIVQVMRGKSKWIKH